MSRLLKTEVDHFSSFRWVECQFKSLQLCPESEYHLDNLLNSLPESLDETYGRMLCSIDKSLIEDSRRILTLLCFSARPLTVSELIDAIAVDISSARLNPKRRLRNADGIRDICVGLVDIGLSPDDTDTSSGKDEHEQTVRIAHFSVQEYLKSERIRSQNAKIFSLTADTAHREITQICLIYILESGFAVEKLDEYPLAYFATRFWLRHYRNTEDQDSKSDNLILQLFQCQIESFVRSIKLLELANEETSDEKRASRMRMIPNGGSVNQGRLKAEDKPSLVYYASLLGLRGVLAELLSAQQQKESGRFILPVTSTSKVADVNAQGGCYGNALQAASFFGHEEIVKMLVHEGADVNAQGGRYGNALQAASFSDHEEIVKMLIHEGADVNAQGGRYGNALQAASSEGHEEIVKILAHEGANLNAQGGRYGNALRAASLKCHEEIVKLIIHEGADVNVQCGGYGSALQAASLEGHEEIVKLLVHEGADVNVQGGGYGSALQAASFRGHEKIVKLLVHEGADINAQGGPYGNALQVAIFGGHEEIVKMLVHEGADVNAQEEGFASVLQAACLKGNEEMVELLVHEGADVNAQGGEYGNTPLQAASLNGNEEIVKLLVHEGADVNVQGGRYGNALQAASFNGNEEIVKMLVHEGADVNAEGGHHGDALQAASLEGHEEIVKMLVHEGADVNAQGGRYGNALQAASFGGHEEIVKMLVHEGADFNAKLDATAMHHRRYDPRISKRIERFWKNRGLSGTG